MPIPDPDAVLTIRKERIQISESVDIPRVHYRVNTWMQDLGFRVIEKTKFLTAVSELCRNALVHGGGGEADLKVIDKQGKLGVQATITDRGPGIDDLKDAMSDGFSSSGGLGLGLGGSKRLVDEFEIESWAGSGTTIRIIMWLTT